MSNVLELDKERLSLVAEAADRHGPVGGRDDSEQRQLFLIERLAVLTISATERANLVREWMNSYDPPLSYQKAAGLLGVKKAMVQMWLVPLTVGEDLHYIIDARDDSLHAAQRIDPVKLPALRKLMGDLFVAGVSFPAIRPLRDIEKINSHTVRARLITDIRRAHEEGTLDWARIHDRIKKLTGAAVVNETASDGTVKREGVKGDLLASLDTIIHQVEVTPLLEPEREQMRERAETLLSLLDRGEIRRK